MKRILLTPRIINSLIATTLLAITLLTSFAFGQNCSAAVVPPAVVNGVTVTATSTGFVTTYPTAFTSCTFVTPANSLHLGSSGAFTYTFQFSSPVNNVVFIMTATGMPGNETFTFTTNNGTPTIVDLGSCFTTITGGNTIVSGNGAGSGGGGGIFEVNNTSGPFTSFTISGPGGLNGSLFGLCESSVVPTPSGVTGTDVTCFGACDGAATVAVGNNPPYTYQWDAAAGSATTSSVSNLCAGTYSVDVTDGVGTTETLQVTIDEPAELQPSVSSSANVLCFGGNSGSATISATGGTGTLSYNIGNGPVASGTFSNLIAGNYNVTVTDASGCTVDQAFSITEPTQLVLNTISAIDAGCPGTPSGMIEVAAAGGTGPYTYSINGSSPVASGVFNALTDGNYNLSTTDANSCTASTTIVLTASPAVLASETVVDESCPASCDGSIEINTSQGTAPFSFSIDNCVTNVPTNAFNALCPGQYAICVTDANGCNYTNTVTIGTISTVPDASLVPIAALCENETAVPIQATTMGVLSGNSGINGTTFDPQLVGPGTYELINTINGTCPAADTIQVTVFPVPVVSMTSDLTVGCVELEVAFSSTGDPGVLYQWNFGDGFDPQNSANVTHTYTQSGQYDITLVVTDANGCSASQTYADYIQAVDGPLANFNFSPQHPNSLDPQVEFDDLSEYAATWYWVFDDLDVSNEQNPTFTFPAKPGNYDVTLYVTSAQGCIDSITKTVHIEQGQLLFVPNTFTPDDNEFNQLFVPVMAGIDTYHYHLTIYNRWGELLFESFDPLMGWDGTYHGRKVQEGTYIWQIELDEIYTAERQEFRGHVLLLR